MQQAPLNSIVIVGGGTAGWISAAVLAHVLRNTGCKITLVESPDIPIIGVGEATIPSFVDLLQFLKIPESDFIANTNASFKLGIKFVDWLRKDHHYWHPFGAIGSKIDGKDFYQHWLKSQLHGSNLAFTDFSPAIAMAKQGRFFIPDPSQPSNLSRSGHALHFDAALAAKYLANYAQAKGVHYCSANVQQVEQSADGRISRLQLDRGEPLAGDFFIDCSGQRALLIQQTLRVGYVDWQAYLPVNSAAVVQTENGADFPPYTEATAHEHGWRWRIPLQNRTGNGYVFCRDFCSDDEATALLMQHVSGQPLNNPRIIRFTTGKRDKCWYKNCLAIGLSSGFLEPLESTSIYLALKGITNFVQMLPNQALDQVTIDEYNRLMDSEYDCIRDFIVLHYCATERTDSAFWRMWQTLPIPASLEQKLALFNSQGRLFKNERDLFAPDSWYAVLEGMNLRPRDYDHTVDASIFEQVQRILAQGAEALEQSAAQVPLHRDFVQQLLAQHLQQMERIRNTA